MALSVKTLFAKLDDLARDVTWVQKVTPDAVDLVTGTVTRNELSFTVRAFVEPLAYHQVNGTTRKFGDLEFTFERRQLEAAASAVGSVFAPQTSHRILFEGVEHSILAFEEDPSLASVVAYARRAM